MMAIHTLASAAWRVIRDGDGYRGLVDVVESDGYAQTIVTISADTYEMAKFIARDCKRGLVQRWDGR